MVHTSFCFTEAKSSMALMPSQLKIKQWSLVHTSFCFTEANSSVALPHQRHNKIIKCVALHFLCCHHFVLPTAAPHAFVPTGAVAFPHPRKTIWPVSLFIATFTDVQ